MNDLKNLVTTYPVVAYLLLISIVTFVMFGYDKFKARTGWWRTPEATLLGFCLFGGSIGGGAGMMLFRHKVSKRSFLGAYWSIVALQLVALVAWGMLGFPGFQKTGAAGGATENVVISIEPTPRSGYQPEPYSANR